MIKLTYTTMITQYFIENGTNKMAESYLDSSDTFFDCLYMHIEELFMRKISNKNTSMN